MKEYLEDFLYYFIRVLIIMVVFAINVVLFGLSIFYNIWVFIPFIIVLAASVAVMCIFIDL